MGDIIKIIAEEIQSFVEGSYDAQGVADKAYEKFHIYGNDANTKAMAGMQQDIEEPVANYGGSDIYLNPKSLNNFDPNVRAISDDKGDLYVVQKSVGILHGEMGRALELIDNNLRIYDVPDKFLLLQRVKDTNKFGFGDTSYGSYYRSNNYKIKMNELLNKVKQVNPQFEYIPEYYSGIR